MTFRGYCAGLFVVGEAVQVGPSSVQDAIESVVALVQTAREKGRVVHLLGNGGSAAVVSHAQNDLVKGCGVRALVHQDIPTLTAYTNDHGYVDSLAGPLGVWEQIGDVVIAVSSAGKSPNIVQAATAAKAKGGLTVITLSGFQPDNPLRQLGNVNFYVPSSDYGCVELTHAALLHYLTDRLAHAG